MGGISSRTYIYYLPAKEDGSRLMRVAVSIYSRLQPFLVELTTVNEHVIQARMKHTLPFIYLASVYATAEVCQAAKKDGLYETLLTEWMSPLGT